MKRVQHGADSDDSKGSAPARAPFAGVLALRGALAALALAGVLCLLAATFATIIRITAAGSSTGTRVVGSDSGWDRHGPALIVLALLGLWLLATGLRGARVALAGLAVVGLVAMVIAFASDRPDVHATGSVGDVYEEATADPGAGYYLETLGGVLLLVGGGVLLLLGGGGGRAAGAGDGETRRRTTTAAPEGGRRED